MKHKVGLHLFRRDLRLDDNTALLAALNQCDEVYCCFIFTPTQIKQNDYRSETAVQFLIESLDELNNELQKRKSHLNIFYGETESILGKIIETQSIDAVFLNKDYTPFSKKRDVEIRKICTEHKVTFSEFDDALLTAPGSVHKDDGLPYTIYTPFYRKASQQEVAEPKENNFTNFAKIHIGNDTHEIFENVLPKKNYNEKLFEHGGRTNGLVLLKEARTLTNYKQTRDIPSIRGTSHLSAHHKFGTLSIREVYWTMREATGGNSQFILELYWRDFATHIAYHFPHVFGHAFKNQYDELPWENDSLKFNAWCEGKTGFPIVDAGMRELNTTGYMHNRVRMIVASFLTKDLHIDWQWGEKYFAQKLIDYDPAVNNTSWQWAASTGCDAQPYFRIFNPWLQQKRYDADCSYIKKWIPELQECEAVEIHNLEKQRPIFPCSYPKPIVDHADAKDIALAMFKSIR